MVQTILPAGTASEQEILQIAAACETASTHPIGVSIVSAAKDQNLVIEKPAEIEEIIHSLGFFRSKAKNLVALAQTLLADFGGIVPDDVDELQKLPGVGRKTANVVMCEAFKNPQGIAVDTHVFRIAHRFGFATRNDDTPAKTEAKLLKIYPQSDWLYINHQWVHFGREFCRARNPLCAECPVNSLCPSFGKA